MISVQDALDKVIALAPAPVAEEVPLGDAQGRVLCDPVRAALSQPPFNSAAMDGYALRVQDLPGPLRVIGEAAAGRPWHGKAEPGCAVRIFTGAEVPDGFDHVELQEHVARDGDQIQVITQASGHNIRPLGGDFAAGACFAPKRPLTAADLGLIAAMNAATLSVARKPRVAVLAGGDELVPPGTPPGPGQIICSNDIAVAAVARTAGADAFSLPTARDTEDSLRTQLNAAIAAKADVIVTIGGASVGDHDLIAPVTQSMGLEREFHKVAMRPGKPLMAGRLDGAVMLGLPGNPVSSIVCAMIFLVPLLRAMQGLAPSQTALRARLGAALPQEGNRQHYLRAKLSTENGRTEITPMADQDSARLGILAQADALLIRPAHDPARAAGEIVEYLPLS